MVSHIPFVHSGAFLAVGLTPRTHRGPVLLRKRYSGFELEISRFAAVGTVAYQSHTSPECLLFLVGFPDRNTSEFFDVVIFQNRGSRSGGAYSPVLSGRHILNISRSWRTQYLALLEESGGGRDRGGGRLLLDGDGSRCGGGQKPPRSPHCPLAGFCISPPGGRKRLILALPGGQDKYKQSLASLGLPQPQQLAQKF